MSFRFFSDISPWQWLSATLLALMVPWAAHQAMALLPDRIPISVPANSIMTEMRSADVWRVTRTSVIREQCGSLVARRFFRGEINGIPVPDIAVEAIASSRPHAMGAVTATAGRAAGEYTEWWDYKLPPGFAGSYIVSVAAADCPSGYNGVFTLFVAPVP
jgi:hypothetical protein